MEIGFKFVKKVNNKCVGVQFALNVDGDRAARFIIERLKKILIIWQTLLITVFVPFELLFQYYQMEYNGCR